MLALMFICVVRASTTVSSASETGITAMASGWILECKFAAFYLLSLYIYYFSIVAILQPYPHAPLITSFSPRLTPRSHPWFRLPQSLYLFRWWPRHWMVIEWMKRWQWLPLHLLRQRLQHRPQLLPPRHLPAQPQTGLPKRFQVSLPAVSLK